MLRCLGYPEEPSKTQIGQDVTLLGVSFSFGSMSYAVPELKLAVLALEIEAHLHKNSLSAGEASKLRGKLIWTLSSLGGVSAKSFLVALVERQYSKQLTSRLTPALIESLSFFRKLCTPLKALPMCIPNRGLRDEQVTMYSDGCSAQGRHGIGAVWSYRDKNVWITSTVPGCTVKGWGLVNHIFLVELVAVYFGLKHFAQTISNRRIIFLIDNSGAFYALCKGCSSCVLGNPIIRRIFELIDKLKCNVWWEYVESNNNVADGPSRFMVDLNKKHDIANQMLELGIDYGGSIPEVSRFIKTHKGFSVDIL